MCNGQMSIPYERFVHCPDHKLLYNFNKYVLVCKKFSPLTSQHIVHGLLYGLNIGLFQIFRIIKCTARRYLVYPYRI